MVKIKTASHGALRRLRSTASLSLIPVTRVTGRFIEEIGTYNPLAEPGCCST